MSSQEAASFRRAARIVQEMDVRTQWMSQTVQITTVGGGGGGWTSPSYSQEQAAIWDAYQSAARVLFSIAAELDKAETAAA